MERRCCRTSFLSRSDIRSGLPLPYQQQFGKEFEICSGCRWWLTYSSQRTPWGLYRPPTNAGRCDTQFNVYPRFGKHLDESPCLWNNGETLYRWVRIQTQARQLGGVECAYLEVILPVQCLIDTFIQFTPFPASFPTPMDHQPRHVSSLHSRGDNSFPVTSGYVVRGVVFILPNNKRQSHQTQAQALTHFPPHLHDDIQWDAKVRIHLHRYQVLKSRFKHKFIPTLKICIQVSSLTEGEGFAFWVRLLSCQTQSVLQDLFFGRNVCVFSYIFSCFFVTIFSNFNSLCRSQF